MNTGLSVDMQTSEKRSLRLYFLDFDAWDINVPELVDGEKVTGDESNCVYAEVSDNVIKGYAVGENVEIDLGKALNLPMEYQLSVTVKGIVKSPLTFGKDGEPSYNNPEDTEVPDNMVKLGKLDLLENVLYWPVLPPAGTGKRGFIHYSGGQRSVCFLFGRLQSVCGERKVPTDRIARRRH